MYSAGSGDAEALAPDVSDIAASDAGAPLPGVGGWYAGALLPAALFLIATVFLGSALDPFYPIKTFFFRMYATCGVLLWLAACFFSGRIRLPKTAADPFLAALLAWFAASFFYAINKT
ncbi:MAG TPA: hypothetical protein PLQ76_09665, partial [bacterium]|nr:hypothetical protein [bacterium]